MSDILVIDNFDSFTFNLVDALECAGARAVVRRNSIALDEALALLDGLQSPRIVLSPGPGHPREAGVCIDLIRACPANVPLLGVCLGHQAIVEAFGGRVSHARDVVHGNASMVSHDGVGLFDGLRSPLPVARYHSLAASELAADLRSTAELGDGTCMAVRHRTRPIFGLQFHPESILTPSGSALLGRFLAMNVTGGTR